MDAVEPISPEEILLAVECRDHLARKHMDNDGMDKETAVAAATARMLVMAYRTALSITSEEMTGDVEKFLEDQ